MPKVLVNARKQEQRARRRVGALMSGTCSLEDPLLHMLKAARKNPYAKQPSKEGAQQGSMRK